MTSPGQRQLAWARRWLDPSVVALVVEPAVADLQHEWHSAPAKRRPAIRAQGHRDLLRTLVGAIAFASHRRLKSASWPLLCMPLCLSVLGTFGLSTGATKPLAAAHLANAILGVAIAFAIVVWPLRRLRELAPSSGADGPTPTSPSATLLRVAIPIVLAIVGVVGNTYDGISAWITIGPLNVHVAMLLTPVFIVTLSRMHRQRDAMAAACMGALLLQANVAMLVLWATLYVVVATHRKRAVALAALAVTIGLAFRHGVSGPLHIPDVHGWLERYGAPAVIAAAMIHGAIITALAASRWTTFEPAKRRLVLALATLLGAWPLLGPFFGEGAGLLSYGGSVSVAMFAAFGLWLRESPIAQRDCPA